MRNNKSKPRGRTGIVQFCLAALAMAAATAVAADDSVRVIVAYKAGGAQHVKGAVIAARGKVKHEIHGMNAMSVEISPRALADLQKHSHVDYIEEDVKRYMFSSTTASTGSPYLVGQLVPYGIHMVQADQMPNDDSLTSNRKICIIDSGYDNTHEDLSGNSVTGEYDVGTGWWYTDELQHGTHVAGTIAAINNGVGVVGANPNKQLKLHIVKVFGVDGWAYSSTLASAANKCATAGANIISMSLGGSRSSRTEQRAFDALQSMGILSIAAAGNDGNTAMSYPASYASVMSVAALDENKQWATFSQRNRQVEIAAPGVNVLSTVPMGAGAESSLSVGGITYTPGDMDGSPKITVTAALADFGLGGTINAAMTGKVCLIARGNTSFAAKVSNCQASGGVGAIVYNNIAGGFTGTLGTTVTTIPTVTASDTDGAAMKNQLGQNATVTVATTNYAYYDGTSMATPHVAAVAALVWSYFPSCTGTQIRNSLDKSAMDLGAIGRDVKFGYGLVQARAAYNRIQAFGCGN